MKITPTKENTWKVKVSGHDVLKNPMDAAQSLQEDTIIAIDLETTGLNPWKNEIATIQLYGEDTSTLALIQIKDGVVPECLKWLFTPGRTFVAHNGVAFDIMFLNNAGIPWRESKWHDTLVGETVLASTGRRDISKSLRGSVRRRLGKEIDKDIEHGHWTTQLTPDQIVYAVEDVLSLPALYRTQLAKATETNQSQALAMEMELVPIVAQMTVNGLPCTTEKVGEYVQEQRLAIKEAEKYLVELFGNINLNSPVQLKKALASVGIVLDSTAADVLLELSMFGGPNAKILENILQWRHGAQRIKMYSEAWQNEHIIGGYIHPRFWQCSADTTRFTCSDPNLQQIPKDGRKIIGNIKGMKIVSADYSQIEVRIAAYQANDEVMMELLEEEDVHTAIAASVFEIKPSQVSKDQRKLAKAMTFLLLFGGGTEKFYQYVKMSGSKISFDQAADIVYRFFSRFTAIRTIRKRAEAIARKSGPAFIRLPNTCRRILVGNNKRSTVILNTMVQGTAAVGIKYGMLEADKRGLTKYLGGQVHDELVAAVPAKQAKEYAHELSDAMITGMNKVIESTVRVETKIGDFWLP